MCPPQAPVVAHPALEVATSVGSHVGLPRAPRSSAPSAPSSPRGSPFPPPVPGGTGPLSLPSDTKRSFWMKAAEMVLVCSALPAQLAPRRVPLRLLSRSWGGAPGTAAAESRARATVAARGCHGAARAATVPACGEPRWPRVPSGWDSVSEATVAIQPGSPRPAPARPRGRAAARGLCARGQDRNPGMCHIKDRDRNPGMCHPQDRDRNPGMCHPQHRTCPHVTLRVKRK